MPYADPERRLAYNRERQERMSWRARINARTADTRRMLDSLPQWLAPRMVEPTGARLVRVMREDEDE